MTTLEVWHQFFAAISANLIGFSFGWSGAWANANFIYFTSNKTSLSGGPLTESEAPLFMSLICAGGLSGNLLYLWMLDRYGRKMSILFLGVPAIASWIFIIYAENAYWLFASRILCGFVGGAHFISAPIFISEICSDSVRGIVNAMGFFMCTMGTLIGFIVAMYLDFRMQAVCGLSIPLLFMLMFSFVPESPEYLYKKNKLNLANISLRYYKGPNQSLESEKMMTKRKSENVKINSDSESPSVLPEANKIDPVDVYQNLHEELITPLQQEKTTEIGDEKQNRIERVYNLVKNRATRRAVYIALVLVFLPQFCGCYILLSYSTAYFHEAGSSLTPLQSSVLICIVQMIANLLTMLLIDQIGRKILYTTSSIGAGLGMLVLALHDFYRNDLPGINWVPIYGLSFTIFVASIGLLPVSYVITVDVLPPNIRNVTMTMCSMIMWIVGFATNEAYLHLLKIINLYGCLLVFSLGCFSCAFYAIVFIPETKGKSFGSVAKLLEKS